MNFKKIFLILIIGLFSTTSFADISVQGYHKKDGTYVKPHYRSNPDSTTNNNWSTKGNINPHTGKKGTKNPQNNNSF